VIPPITLKDAQDLFDLRALLEPVAARRAAGHVDPAQLRLLDGLCRAQYHLGDRDSSVTTLWAIANSQARKGWSPSRGGAARAWVKI
jgi:DNA-binding GntR family transcriptional regulator